MKNRDIWKPIKGYEGLYEVSNLGNIRSLNRIIKYTDGRSQFYKGKIIKQGKDKDGYLQVGLSKNGKAKTYKVHRLVANAFIPNNNCKLTINHINGIKTDNRVENLEWTTQSENNKHAFKIGLKKINQAQIERFRELGKRNSKKIVQYNKQNKFLKIWESTIEIERQLGLKHNNISACCRGKQKTVGGFIWRYAE